MKEKSVGGWADERGEFEAALTAIEGAPAFHVYCERLHHFAKTGHGPGLLQESRHALVALARGARWTPSVVLKAVRRGCYIEDHEAIQVGRHASEVDRLLYAYFNVAHGC